MIAWDSSSWDLVNMTISEEKAGMVCRRANRPGHVLFPERRTMKQHKAICSKMKGEPSTVDEENMQVLNL